jgi:hypothetical protein
MFTDLNKEKLLTGFVIFSIVLDLLMNYFNVQPALFEFLYAVSLSLLLGHYLFGASRLFYKLVMLGLFAGILMYFFIFMSWPYASYCFMAGGMAQFVFGAAIFYKGIKDTIKTKDFEIFVYLTGGLLMITALVSMLPGIYLSFFNQRLLLENAEFLPFPLVGVILTVMVNENIWDDFLPEEKNLLKYIVLIHIIPLVTVLWNKYLM